MSIQFPDPFKGNGRGVTPSTPIIGQQQVPTIQFAIQITPELHQAVVEYVQQTGLDGNSFMNYVFTRGLTAIRQDLIYAQEERDSLREETGSAHQPGTKDPDLGG
jgi:hypothetical protein